ncbi:MAG TPA: hypothetical protein VF584_26775 [Longimicrobium sp.]|jgi:hypothetical protein
MIGATTAPPSYRKLVSALRRLLEASRGTVGDYRVHKDACDLVDRAEEIPAPLELDERQTGTVLAALRYWQRNAENGAPEWEIATEPEGGALDEDEIDALCERINCSPGDADTPVSMSPTDTRALTLFTSTQAGASAEQRTRLSAEVLAVLRAEFKIDVIGHLHGQPLVRLDAHPHYYTSWYLGDNGGELNVGPINRDEEMRSVPYFAWSTLLDAGTIAYRVAAVIRDEVIDYDLRRPKLVQG